MSCSSGLSNGDVGEARGTLFQDIWPGVGFKTGELLKKSWGGYRSPTRNMDQLQEGVTGVHMAVGLVVDIYRCVLTKSPCLRCSPDRHTRYASIVAAGLILTVFTVDATVIGGVSSCCYTPFPSLRCCATCANVRQICTKCPPGLLPYHIEPNPQPDCSIRSTLPGNAPKGRVWHGALCPEWCLKTTPVGQRPTASGRIDMRSCPKEASMP